MQLGPKDWPKFQEQLKKLQSAEICQTNKLNRKGPIINLLKNIYRKLQTETSAIEKKIIQISGLSTNSQNR